MPSGGGSPAKTSTYGLDPSGGLDVDERALVLKCEVWKLDERVTSRRVYVTLTHLNEQNERISSLSVQRPVRLVQQELARSLVPL